MSFGYLQLKLQRDSCSPLSLKLNAPSTQLGYQLGAHYTKQSEGLDMLISNTHKHKYKNKYEYTVFLNKYQYTVFVFV